MSATLEQVEGQSFDYIICGGGTAGLTLASRLSEDPTIAVLVLEAGKANSDDPNILRPASFGAHFANDDYAWPHQTIKQKHTDLQHYWHRGKGLGGSSAINFQCWTKPPAQDIDDLEALGNPGWNWSSLHKYIARAEGFTQPSEEVAQRLGVSFDGWQIGREGPLKVAYPASIPEAELKIREAIVNAGIPRSQNPYDGNPTGAFIALNSYDPSTHTRSYSATAYFNPAKHRANLTVLVSAPVNRIVLEVSDNGNFTATGVEFECNGTVHVVNAKREVILSAGSLRSPQILELSGIGRKDVLEKLDIPIKVELPGVGENLQEHINATINYEIRDDVEYDTLDILKDPEVAAKHLQLYESGKGIFTSGLIGFAFAPLQIIAPHRIDAIIATARQTIEKNADAYPPGLLAQYKIQLQRLESGSPGCEIISFPGCMTHLKPAVPGKRYITIGAAMNHMWSRGSVHATSQDPRAFPECDPHYFEQDIDMQMFVELVNFIRNFTKESPFKDLVTDELNPGRDLDGDEQVAEWIKKALSTTWHGCGTCSMLPKASGGVVDPDLKVYGTNNVRVVDLSILPLHFASHPQASVYGIAEKAADIIKGQHLA